MDWIFDNFQILALVGLALASWLKSRADAKAAEREEREARRELEEPEDIFGPGEAWGRPFQETPAPPPLVRPAPPPLPAFEIEAEMRRQTELQERLQKLREAKAVTTGGAAATRARATEIKTPQAGAAVPVDLRGALRRKGQVRRAIVMREILGPPLGLR